MLAPPYTAAAVRSALGGGVDDVEAIRDALVALDARGVSAPAIALVLDAAAPTGTARPDLVWSGPSAPGPAHTQHAAGLRRADRHGRALDLDQHLRLLRRAARVQVTRRPHDGDPRAPGPDACSTSSAGTATPPPAEELVAQFAHRFWSKDWPGDAKPAVYYDPRSLEPDGPEGVLHAKAIVADDQAALVTSANLTEAAFDRNIEVGILTRDQLLAASLVQALPRPDRPRASAATAVGIDCASSEPASRDLRHRRWSAMYESDRRKRHKRLLAAPALVSAESLEADDQRIRGVARVFWFVSIRRPGVVARAPRPIERMSRTSTLTTSVYATTRADREHLRRLTSVRASGGRGWPSGIPWRAETHRTRGPTLQPT